MNLKTEEVLSNSENEIKEHTSNKRKCSDDESGDTPPCKKNAYAEEGITKPVEDVKEFSNLESFAGPKEVTNDVLMNGATTGPCRTGDLVKNIISKKGHEAKPVENVNQSPSLRDEIVDSGVNNEATENATKSLENNLDSKIAACNTENANFVEVEDEISGTKEAKDQEDDATKKKQTGNSTKSPDKTKKPPNTFVPQSPKKRLEFEGKANETTKKKTKFIYGNYSQYYGYRNKDKDFHDIRLDVFAEHRELFANKQILDIGCNSGFITMEVAKRFEVKSIAGLDIDKHLINQAIKQLTRHKKSLPLNNELRKQHKFPFNVTFVHGNYVLRDAVLLEIERPQFDVILCLSITKWIHLNFGDDGLKLAFKRMYLQLKPKGILILEAQPFDNYSRRKKMTEQIFTNYKNMKFFPNNFEEYLLSSEVGFTKVQLMGVPDHCEKGFKRPIQIFYKN